MKTIKGFLAKLVLAFGLLASVNAHAGIPVIDAANLAQSIQQVTAWAQQYEQMATQLQQQIQQYQQQITSYNSTMGSRGMGTTSVIPSSSTLPPDWSNALASIKSTSAYTTARAALPQSPDPATNAAFDQKAAGQAALTNFFAATNQRIQNASTLMGQINSASDPAAKNDLTNRLINEQNSIAADKQVLSVIKAKLEQDQETADVAARKSLMCQEFGHAAGC
jgi:type IV secretion system protein VirB5